MTGALARTMLVRCALLVSTAVSASAQGSSDSSAGQAIALTSASTVVAMNPAIFGELVRGALDLSYAHKPQWETRSAGLSVGSLRVQLGSGHFNQAPFVKEYFVGIDFARVLLNAPVNRYLSFVIGADGSIGYGAEDFGGNRGDVGETMGGFVAAGLKAKVRGLSVTPYFAPGFFHGRYTIVETGSRSSKSGNLVTQGGGVRVELADRLRMEFAVRKTRIAGAIPRYGMSAGLNALSLPKGGISNVNDLRLEMENDYFTFWIPPAQRPDEDYTNGLRVSFERNEPLRGLGVLSPNRPSCRAEAPASECALARIEIGQEIYTPIDDSYSNLKFDRPYAGWLYGNYTGHILSDRQDRSIGISLGVIGPQSLAEQVQTAFHSLFPWYRHPNGWEKQLSFEPGVVVSAARRYLVGGWSRRADYIQIIPEWKLSAGNVLAGASAKGTVRFGYQLPHPWNARQNGRRLFGAYALGAIREDLVLHDIFLDGNTFRGHSQVTRVPWIWQREWGGGVRLGFLTAEYRAVIRQREYRVKTVEDIDVARGFSPIAGNSPGVSGPILDIPKSHPYGSLSLTINRSF